MGRKLKAIKGVRISKEELLALLKAGAILTVAITAPNALQVLKPLFTKENGIPKEYYPSSLNRNLKMLWRSGSVDVKEGSHGYSVIITKKGQQEVLKYDLEKLSLTKPERWDGRWRMVFFDIPKRREKVRHKFRESLRAMNFFPMQKLFSNTLIIGSFWFP